MPLPAWPVGLPYETEIENYQVTQLGQPLLKSPMQSGRTRMRRQYTVRIASLRWARRYGPAELLAFRSFVIDTLGDGSSRFTMPVWDASVQSFPTKTVMIENGVEGISESDLVSETMVSMTLLVEGF